MKNVAQLSALSALSFSLLASFGAHAADTAELKVKGVIRPSACVPSFAGNSNTVDYGTIAAKDIPANAAKVLDERPIAFTVTCDAATKVAVRALDNRQASVVPGLLANVGSWATDRFAYGLGTVSGKNIGVYKVRMPQGGFKADGATPDLISDATNNNTWTKSGGGHFYADGNGRISAAVAGTTTPMAVKVMSGDIMVQAVLNKGSELPLTQEINLDGSATIEVQYL